MRKFYIIRVCTTNYDDDNVVVVVADDDNVENCISLIIHTYVRSTATKPT